MAPKYKAALDGLQTAERQLGAGYREAAVSPLRSLIDKTLDQQAWDQFFRSHLAGGDLGCLVLDAVSALSDPVDLPVTRALHEVICDYYDGFASSQDRAGVALATGDRRPPLPLWTRASPAPYAYGRKQTGILGLSCGLVAMPQAYASGGVAAWCVVAHETAGHGLLEGEPALRAEAATLLSQALEQILPELAAATAPAGAVALYQEQAAYWATYWPSVVEEVLADMLGVLNQGPAAAGGAAVLLTRAVSEGEDPAGRTHPHAALRLFTMAEAVRQTLQSPDDVTAAIVDSTAEMLIATLKPAWLDSLPLARSAARIVARTVIGSPLSCLGHKPLNAVQRWSHADERLVSTLAKAGALPRRGLRSEIYAAHIVAAAWRRAWDDDAKAFAWMIEALGLLHQRNPLFGPIALELPGDLAPQYHSSPVQLPPVIWPKPPPPPRGHP